MAVPLEATHLEGLVAVGAVLKVIRIDHIDNGHKNTGARILDALQQWLTPALVRLAVSVQKDEHIAAGNPSAGQSSAYQTQAAGKKAKKKMLKRNSKLSFSQNGIWTNYEKKELNYWVSEQRQGQRQRQRRARER